MVSVSIVAALAVLALTGALLVLYEWRRDFRFDFLAVFLGCYAVLYVLVPALIVLNPEFLSAAGANWASTFERLRTHAVAGAVAVCGFAVVLLATYEAVHVRGRFDGVDAHVRRFAGRVADDVDHDMLFLTGVLLLLVGAVSYVLYALSAGGVIEVLTHGQALRSGNIDERPVEPIGINFSFAKHFLRVAFLSTFVFLGVDPDSRWLRRLRLPLLAVSVVVSVATLIVYASRTHIIVFASVFAFANEFGTRVERRTVRNVALVLPAAVLVIAFARPILATVAGLEGYALGSLRRLWLEPIADLSPPFISLLVAIDNVTAESAGWGYWFSRLFVDILPGQLLGIDGVRTMNEYNTSLFGYESSTEEYTYTIAAGMLAYYYYEFYVLGTLVGGVVAGVALSLLDRFLDAVGRSSPYHVLLLYAAMMMFVGMLNGDPSNILKNNVGIVGGLALVFAVQYVNSRYVTAKKGSTVEG